MKSGALCVETFYKELGKGMREGFLSQKCHFMHYECVPKLLSYMQQVNGHHCYHKFKHLAVNSNLEDPRSFRCIDVKVYELQRPSSHSVSRL